MQIVEATSFGVRSAVMTLTKAGDPVCFRLFPMIHIAEPGFYREVERQLAACDVVLLEGVKSSAVSIVTLSYRLLSGTKRLGLVSQREMDLGALKSRIIRSDMSSRDFKRGWAALHFPIRAFMLVAGPAYGLYLRIFGTREQIAASMGVELLPDSKELLWDSEMESVRDLILHARDGILLDNIGTVRSSEEKLTVAVVYGAKHMRAVIHYLLDKAGYRIAKSEFVTVMSL
jgi:hypothetical protein